MNKDEIYITEDGSHSIVSGKFEVSYHSRHGAIAEAYHVFIDAALRFKAVVQKDISILEIGLGTGLNAYITLLETLKRNLNINYTGVEAYPLSNEQINQLNYPSQLEPDFTEHFMQIHQTEWNTPSPITEQFTLTKLLSNFEDINFENQFDIIYFDAFAPNAQPELWGEEMFLKMYTALKPEGILTTYCAKGVVKRTMKSIGFTVEALPGPPGKREMTRALKS